MPRQPPTRAESAKHAGPELVDHVSPNTPGTALSQRLQRAWLARGWLVMSLLPLSWLFGGLSAVRRAMYRVGLFRTHTLTVPVVVVGNLIAGGAGKTPTVMAVVELLRRRGFVPGIISRGYGRVGQTVLDVRANTAASQCGDEPLLMKLRCSAPVCVGRDRVAAGGELLRLHPTVNVIVSDDGLQHLRLGRTAQVLVFDERGAGNGWLLPAGPLRERVPATMPERSVVLYNAPTATTELLGSVARRSLRGVVALQAWRSGQASSSSSLASLRGRTVVAAAGLAHPDRFFSMLREFGLVIIPLPLPDHFDFQTLPWPAETEDVVVTEKDAVKLDPCRLGRTRVWVAALDFTFDTEFETALLALLPSPPLSRN